MPKKDANKDNFSKDVITLETVSLVLRGRNKKLRDTSKRFIFKGVALVLGALVGFRILNNVKPNISSRKFSIIEEIRQLILSYGLLGSFFGIKNYFSSIKREQRARQLIKTHSEHFIPQSNGNTIIFQNKETEEVFLLNKNDEFEIRAVQPKKCEIPHGFPTRLHFLYNRKTSENPYGTLLGRTIVEDGVCSLDKDSLLLDSSEIILITLNSKVLNDLYLKVKKRTIRIN